MILLINKSIVALKIQVAIGYDPIEFNTFINEAQEFDFKPLVLEEFYFDLLSKKDLAAWKKLIDGGNYTYENREYQFQGISTVLSYFAFARFKMDSSAVSTSHGFVVKTNPNSTPLGLDERKNAYYRKREEANLIMLDVIKFIERNLVDYPSWKNSECSLTKNNYAPITRVIQ